jgi:hypothetical protein
LSFLVPGKEGGDFLSFFFSSLVIYFRKKLFQATGRLDLHAEYNQTRNEWMNMWAGGRSLMRHRRLFS